MFLLTYMGWRTSCVRLAEIPREIDAVWGILSLLFNREDKINILQVIDFVSSKLALEEHRSYYPNGTGGLRKKFQIECSWMRTWSSKIMWSVRNLGVSNVDERGTNRPIVALRNMDKPRQKNKGSNCDSTYTHTPLHPTQTPKIVPKSTDTPTTSPTKTSTPPIVVHTQVPK